METVHSDLIVISWWSNCLGLTCLHRLVAHTRHRNIYLVQVGKTERQKELFREYMPTTVKELPYAAEVAAEHGRVIEAVAYELLPAIAGLWFIDHDTFMEEDSEAWFERMDDRFSQLPVCLGYPQTAGSLAITQPAFWLSPRRLPSHVPRFTVSPYKETMIARQPYGCHPPADLIVPEKDTLVLAKEFLERRGLADSFLLSTDAGGRKSPLTFPHYTHLSGIYVLANSTLSDQLYDWMSRCIQRLTHFYQSCPSAWLAIEDPVLRQRLQQFQVAAGISAGT